jgi:hypothetical protein
MTRERVHAPTGSKHNPRAGCHGLAVQPPPYGIDFADRRLTPVRMRGSAQPIQRKIFINDQEYAGAASDDREITNAIGDEYVRYYHDADEMKAHLVKKTPTPFGLIKERALWYRMPFLTKEFFVFGESHAAVTGPMIKDASNIALPILYEANEGWSVDAFHTRLSDPQGKTRGLDENSSKLYRALAVWNPESLLSSASAGAATPEKIPDIPVGKASTRETERGTYRLVVKGEHDQPKWWTPSTSQATQADTYDANQQALDAILQLFGLVFTKWDLKGTAYGPNFSKAHTYLVNKSWNDHYPKEQRGAILRNIKRFLLEGVQTKVQEQYKLFGGQRVEGIKPFDDPSLKTADDYRNEYIFASLVKGKASTKYAFAAVGNAHLKALKGRLDKVGIRSLSVEEFYGKYTEDAVSVSGASVSEYAALVADIKPDGSTKEEVEKRFAVLRTTWNRLSPGIRNLVWGMTITAIDKYFVKHLRRRPSQEVMGEEMGFTRS